ncbi:MAG: glycoside hydrolase family 2 TIM barrel-domain containing protein [Roseburia sp.]
MTKRIYLNDGWRFTEHFEADLLKKNYDDSELELVRLPHTCKETPYHYFDEHSYQMICGYRKMLHVPKEWKGKKVLLTIDGAAHKSEVFLNGDKIGEHRCGYTAYTMEISDSLVFGAENDIVIKVNSEESLNIPPFGYVMDYMTYGGIYRDVYLEVKNQEYLADVFVKPEFLLSEISKSDRKIVKKATLSTEVLIAKDEAIKENEKLLVRQSIRFLGSQVTKGEEEFHVIGEQEIKQKSEEFCFPAGKIALWDTQHPNLYEVKTELIQEGEILDEKRIRTGFRKAEFREDGFYLNGEKFKIRGLNRHQSYPYVGYAMPESMQKWDADILKEELGVNAVRTSHYPQSHYFLDRCDEIGLLVFTEIPGWQYIGDEEWKKQAIVNVKDMILQYRNHTSIILWGVRINESKDDDAFYVQTNEMAHKLDSTRPTGGVRAHKKSSLLEDVYTYNDFVHDGKAPGCEPKKKVTSNRKKSYLVSEYNGHMYPTKAFDGEEHRVEHALRHANVLDAIMEQDDIGGSFGWCMFDYNTHKDFGSGDRICYHGVMDMFRNPKLAATVYECQQEKYPVLEISSTMDIGEHPGCNRGKTYIFTNADSVRMYKNGHFIKEYRKEDSPYRYLTHGPLLIDDFVGTAVEEGENFKKNQAEHVKKVLNDIALYGLTDLPKSTYLKALGLLLRYHMGVGDAVTLYNKYIGDWGGTSTSYRFEAIKEGEVVKTITKEPMTKLYLKVKTDHTELIEKNSYDVAAVRIQAVDEYENLMNFFQGPIALETEGPIEIIGPKITSLRGGMGGTFVKTTGESGKAVLVIQSEQAGEYKVEFQCK